MYFHKGPSTRVLLVTSVLHLDLYHGTITYLKHILEIHGNIYKNSLLQLTGENYLVLGGGGQGGG